MHQEVALIATFAVGFVLAAVLGYGADRLHLPPLVGYLFAGMVMGPFTPGYVADGDLSQLAEMGVILLMFGVGLHFSASDLMAVRRLAVPGAVIQIGLATLYGTLLCMAWGWGAGTGLVFGLSLSVASTVVVLKALEERNLLNAPHGRVAVGWLITEDLTMVLALVLLPAFATMLGAEGGGHAADESSMALVATVVMTLLKVGAFAAMAILLGPRVVPWLLTMVARTGSRELFTLSVLATALGIAFGSAQIFGVSFAIGAFFAGVVMSESHLSHRAAADSLPLQNAFSVLFFISVGMLFDPAILAREPGPVLAVVALIIFGKAFNVLMIILAMRYPLRLGLAVASSLAQIGEFSFILAGLGVSLGVLPREGQDLILAGAILAITVNPLILLAGERLQKVARQRWPAFYADYGRGNSEALGRELSRINEVRVERERQRQAELQMLLETFPLFSEVDQEDREELLLLFRPRTASPGERVIRQGDRGDAMFFIVSGAVEVRLDSQAIRLEPGAFFGEMALLTGERRTADVIAVDFCQFLVLDRRDFNLFMSRHPKLRAAVSSKARERREMNISRRKREEPPAGE